MVQKSNVLKVCQYERMLIALTDITKDNNAY